MNLGTYDEILLQTVGQKRLVEIMLHTEPGWISERSWEFWPGRLAFATGAAIPQEAPRRVFDAAAPSTEIVDSSGGPTRNLASFSACPSLKFCSLRHSYRAPPRASGIIGLRFFPI
jgi:hypothetical protein